MLKLVTSDDNSKSSSPSSQRDNKHLLPIDAPPTAVSSFSRVADLLRAGEAALNQDCSELHSRRATVLYIIDDSVDFVRATIEIHKVTLLKGGIFGPSVSLQLEQVMNESVSSYIKNEDHKIAKFWSSIGGLKCGSIDNEPELFSMLLSRILSTGRCYLKSKNTTPLRLGDPLDGRFVWKPVSVGHQLSIVARDKFEEEYDSFRWRVPWYFDREKGLCGPIRIEHSAEVIEAVLLAQPVKLTDAPAVQVLFTELGLNEKISAPPTDLKYEIQLVALERSLRVEDMLCLSPVFLGEKKFAVPGTQLKVVAVKAVAPELGDRWIFNASTNSFVVQRIDFGSEQIGPLFESMGFQELKPSVFGAPFQSERYFILPHPHLWLEFVSTHLHALRKIGWRIANDIEEKLDFIEFNADDLIILIEEAENQWFDLSLTLKHGERTFFLMPIIWKVLEDLRGQTRYLSEEAIDSLNVGGKFMSVLPNGKIFSLPFDRIRPLLISINEIVAKELKEKKLRVSIVDLTELEQALKLIKARWLGAARWPDTIKCLKQLNSLKESELPLRFKAKLRPYQLIGLSWLQTLAANNLGGILADDMGLGKTIQMLAHICLEKQYGRLQSPFLVICPKTVLPNWLSEASRFCPHLKVVEYNGPERVGKWPQVEQADIVVSTYPLVLRDLKRLKKIHWHGIALDESQCIKNRIGKTSIVIGSLPANHRFCITGTPIENNLSELWSQFRFLLPGLLGDYQSFKYNFRKPIEEENCRRTALLLAKRIHPFTLRRTKDEVAAELPEKTVIEKTIELTGAQRDLYETVRVAATKTLREAIEKNGIHQCQLVILEAMLRLRQVCCDPRLVPLTAAKSVTESAKLDELANKVEQLVAANRRVLIFSQFTSMLDLIKQELDNRFIKFLELRGSTKDRVKPVKQFQAGEVPVFLISLKAGGTGLNLTAADTVIHYDPWWNPAVENQATDRAHRIGQTKKVFVYKMLTKGTIEQRIVQLQERKKALADLILDETGRHGPTFTEADIAHLFAPIDAPLDEAPL